MSGQVSGVPAAARFVEHARRYSELGWALVRLDGKVPKGKDWQQERPDPSPEHAAGLWSQWGKRWNMGVVLGTSGLVVVEYDTDEAGTKLKELLGGELPLTPIAQTGRGRLHLYFKDAGLSKGARDGLELRAGPHQCVLPPSVHPETGQAYRWMDKLEPWTVALGDVPAAVLAYFADERRNGAAPPLPEVIRIGEIDRTLASLAGSNAAAQRRRGGDLRRARRDAEALRARPHPHRGRSPADRKEHCKESTRRSRESFYSAIYSHREWRKRNSLCGRAAVRAARPAARERPAGAALVRSGLPGPVRGDATRRPAEGRQVDALLCPARKGRRRRALHRPADVRGGRSPAHRGAARHPGREGSHPRTRFFPPGRLP
jgi:hypothetical protein